MAQIQDALSNALMTLDAGDKESTVDKEAVDRLVETLESRFISWQKFFLVVVPSYLAAVSIPIAVSMWVTSQHQAMPTHAGAVSQREWVQIERRLQNMEQDISEIRRAVLEGSGP